MTQHRFVKEGYEWFIDLPEYLEQGGSKGDLQMVSGADTMLNWIVVNPAFATNFTMLYDKFGRTQEEVEHIYYKE